jgi:xanthosine utilization system XapX-like protein
MFLYASLTYNSLFPLAPLAIDLPQYIRRRMFLYASMVSWFGIPIYLIDLIVADRQRSKDPAAMISRLVFEIVFKTLIISIIFGVTFKLVGVTLGAPAGLGTRVGINGLYCGQLVLSIYADVVGRSWMKRNWLMYYGLWIHCIATGMFGVAALLYGIAWKRRHAWVSSRSLGGTGIEPMVLMLPGRGPLYQSVGDETREGAIRLV